MEAQLLRAIGLFAILFVNEALRHEIIDSDSCNINTDVIPILRKHVTRAIYLEISTLFSSGSTVIPPMELIKALVRDRGSIKNIVKKPMLLKLYYFNESLDKQKFYFDNKTTSVSEEIESCSNEAHYQTAFEQKKVILIIGETLELLYQFLSSRKLHRKRYLHILFLLGQEQSGGSAALFLKTLWDKERLLNCIMYLPCSPSTNTDIYIYRPFQINKFGHGVIKKYKISDVKNCPYLILNDVKNLNGLSLTVSIFTRNTSAYSNPPKLLENSKIYRKIPETSEIYGLDGILTSEISIAMNFTIKRSSNSNDYGYVFSNGTATESAGEVARGEVDLQGNLRFLEMQLYSKNVDYTSPFFHDRICVIIRKAPFIPEWLTPFLEIKLPVWIIIAAYMVISIVVNDILKYSKGKDIVLSFLEIFGMTFSQSLTTASSKGHIGRQFFLSFFLFGTINLSTWFAATLYKSSTVRTYFPDIMTLEELDKRNITMETFDYAFKGSPTELYQRLDKKACEIVNNGEGYQWAATNFNHAALDRVNDAKIIIQSQYVNEDGSPMLHIIPECPIGFYLSLIVPQGSPFTLQINLITVRLALGGFNMKWYNDFGWAIITEKQMKTKQFNDSAKPIYLDKVHLAFYIIIVGNILSTVIFLLEIIIGKEINF